MAPKQDTILNDSLAARLCPEQPRSSATLQALQAAAHPAVPQPVPAAELSVSARICPFNERTAALVGI